MNSLKVMEKSLESITKWLNDSGLVVNKEKTENCLFCKHNMRPVPIRVNEILIESKNVINVLGALFDCKFIWSNQGQQGFECNQVSEKIF